MKTELFLASTGVYVKPICHRLQASQLASKLRTDLHVVDDASDRNLPEPDVCLYQLDYH